MDIREESLIVAHPDFIDNEWQRVDHPTTDPIRYGAPDLGWEGDNRLAIYLHLPTRTFVLWRLESDGEYRPAAKLPSEAPITPAGVNELIRNLIMWDRQRGWNAGEYVIGLEDAAEVEREAARKERTADFADKLHFALSQSHLPGVEIARPRLR